MRIDILSVLPELLAGPLDHSIVQRAREKGLLDLRVRSLRDFTHDARRTVDDYAYGPDAGMVLKPEPIFEAIEYLQGEEEAQTIEEVIYTSPDGELLTQSLANELSLKKRLVILCGHYKGVDHRVREHLITREISIGDYVLSGGELPAAVIVDAVARLLPGAIGDETSALSDSFQDGLVAPPTYTRPAVYRGLEVPEILRSGNFARIAQWQHEMALERTKRLRPDYYRRYGKDE
ncbi:MAG: tRNA (guanosine(37)-N1)-methyltransferase TrmD [Bacteroidetes bacterium]|nr:MAG: tRNA (guanosine(37)-N1)-methyltransferase TrmD [Bacteroidota bacterium]